jgi:hypothetical protein
MRLWAVGAPQPRAEPPFFYADFNSQPVAGHAVRKEEFWKILDIEGPISDDSRME